jgi:hypothetical protein
LHGKDGEELEYDQQLPYSDVHIFGKKVAGRAVNRLLPSYICCILSTRKDLPWLEPLVVLVDDFSFLSFWFSLDGGPSWWPQMATSVLQ